MKLWSIYWLSVLQFTLTCAMAGESPAPARDGSHDFDFLIGNWKAHVRRLPDRLVGSNNWIEYNGISNHKKFLDSNANFEEFEVDNPRSTFTSKARHLGYTIPTRINGVSIFSTWTKVFSACRQSLVNLMATAASSTTRNSTRGARSWCAMSG